MTYFRRWRSKSDFLDKEINAVLASMEINTVESEEYPKQLGYLTQLVDMKAKIGRKPVSKDTIALIFGNLMGILLIVAYEQKHVMSQKGFSQIIRPR